MKKIIVNGIANNDILSCLLTVGVFKTVNSNVANDCHKPVNICLRCVIMKHSGGRY